MERKKDRTRELNVTHTSNQAVHKNEIRKK
jgi:hypothetical protein